MKLFNFFGAGLLLVVFLAATSGQALGRNVDNWQSLCNRIAHPPRLGLQDVSEGIATYWQSW